MNHARPVRVAERGEPDAGGTRGEPACRAGRDFVAATVGGVR